MASADNLLAHAKTAGGVLCIIQLCIYIFITCNIEYAPFSNLYLDPCTLVECAIFQRVFFRNDNSTDRPLAPIGKAQVNKSRDIYFLFNSRFNQADIQQSNFDVE